MSRNVARSMSWVLRAVGMHTSTWKGLSIGSHERVMSA
jgi:hypothetical protein